MRLNGNPMNPGDFRYLITIQSRVTVTDAGGFKTFTWSKIADVWAKWENVHGSEVWAADSVNAVGAATVTIRYRSTVDTTCRLLLSSFEYEIVSVDDIQNRHEFIELKVRRVKAG